MKKVATISRLPITRIIRPMRRRIVGEAGDSGLKTAMGLRTPYSNTKNSVR
jgi:hypothetical protein